MRSPTSSAVRAQASSNPHRGRIDVEALGDAIVSRLEADYAGRRKGDEIRHRCPNPDHPDETPSASYNVVSHVWCCFARGCHEVVGALAMDLAPLVGLEPDAFRVAEPLAIADRAGIRARSPAAEDFDAVCAARSWPERRELAEQFGVEMVVHASRPALRYPTAVGVDRIKYLDGDRPKYRWSASGGESHWYGLDRALELLAGRAVAPVLYLVNGEPSVWTAQHRGVPAVCLCSGESSPPSDELMGQLQDRLRSVQRLRGGEVLLAIAYDNDLAGRNGAFAAAKVLDEAGFTVFALDLSGALSDKPGGDVDDLHALVGADLAHALASLPELTPGSTSSHDSVAPEVHSGPVTARELLARDLPPVRYVVEGLLPEGVNLLIGKPKVGKSWLALGLALSTAAGTAALGAREGLRGEVLYLALEDSPHRLQGRLRQVAARPREAWLGRLQLDTIEGAGDWRLPDGRERLEHWLAAQSEPRLVIVDTLAAVKPLGRRRSQYQADYESLEGLRLLAARYRVAILVVHHQRKLPAALDEDWVDTVNGTTGLAAAADTILALTRDRATGDSLLLLTGRDIAEQTLSLEFDVARGAWSIAGETSLLVRGGTERGIVRLLQGRPGRSGTTADFYRELGAETDSDKTQIRKALGRLTDKGVLLNPNQGRYSLAESSAPAGADNAFGGHRANGADDTAFTSRSDGTAGTRGTDGTETAGARNGWEPYA